MSLKQKGSTHIHGAAQGVSLRYFLVQPRLQRRRFCLQMFDFVV